MSYILLTPEQADVVRGETSPGHALEPVEIVSGDFVLPARVLEDPHHASAHEFLSELPTVEDPEFPASDD